MWETKLFVFGIHILSKYAIFTNGKVYIKTGLPLKDSVYNAKQESDNLKTPITCTNEDIQNVYKKHLGIA